MNKVVEDILQSIIDNLDKAEYDMFRGGLTVDVYANKKYYRIEAPAWTNKREIVVYKKTWFFGMPVVISTIDQGMAKHYDCLTLFADIMDKVNSMRAALIKKDTIDTYREKAKILERIG